MSLPLKPKTLAAAYEYLRSLPPFMSLKLPASDHVQFKVTKRTDVFGVYQWMGNRHRISLSERSIGQSQTLFATLAHEMIHLALEMNGLESKNGGPNVHNAAFRRLAARVCKTHGWDVKAFY